MKPNKLALVPLDQLAAGFCRTLYSAHPQRMDVRGLAAAGASRGLTHERFAEMLNTLSDADMIVLDQDDGTVRLTERLHSHLAHIERAVKERRVDELAKLMSMMPPCGDPDCPACNEEPDEFTPEYDA